MSLSSPGALSYVGRVTGITGVPGYLDTVTVAAAMTASGAVSPDAELVAATAQPVGIGAMADTFRLSLRWHRRGSGPRSVIAKLPTVDEAAARTAASLGAYEREVRFYRELAKRTDVSVPRFYGTFEHNGAPALLLEDLTHMVPGDQFRDVATDTLRRLREQLARLQAPFWADRELAGADWLHRRQGVPIPDIAERMRRSWVEVGRELTADFPTALREQIERFTRHAETWAMSLGGPFSLSHHDYRVDNMLFDPADPARVVVLDWQTVGWGAPMFDVAYLLATSVGPERRRAVERVEIARHVDDLAARGVAWSFEEAWQAYRHASFATLLMLVPPICTVKRSDRTDVMYRRLLRHGAQMALDLRADDFLANQL